MTSKFVVTKRFTAGNLAGIVIREETAVEFAVGDVGGGAWLGSPFIVVAVERVA